MKIFKSLSCFRSPLVSSFSILCMHLVIFSISDNATAAGLILINNSDEVIVIEDDNKCSKAPVFQELSSDQDIIQTRNHKMVPVVFSGKVITAPGCTPRKISYEFTDEYGKLDSSGQIYANGDGEFSITLPMMAYRKGSDKDGRTYTIAFETSNEVGVASTTETWTVTHDNRE